jgi:hypothetical protein
MEVRFMKEKRCLNRTPLTNRAPPVIVYAMRRSMSKNSKNLNEGRNL